MPLTQEDREDIKRVIAEGMKNTCLCGISPGSAKEMSHVMGALKDVGKGDRREGIEVLRDILKWWVKVRSAGEKVGLALTVALVVAIGSGLLGLIWLGINIKLGKG